MIGRILPFEFIKNLKEFNFVNLFIFSCLYVILLFPVLHLILDKHFFEIHRSAFLPKSNPR